MPLYMEAHEIESARERGSQRDNASRRRIMMKELTTRQRGDYRGIVSSATLNTNKKQEDGKIGGSKKAYDEARDKEINRLMSDKKGLKEAVKKGYQAADKEMASRNERARKSGDEAILSPEFQNRMSRKQRQERGRKIMDEMPKGMRGKLIGTQREANEAATMEMDKGSDRSWDEAKAHHLQRMLDKEPALERAYKKASSKVDGDMNINMKEGKSMAGDDDSAMMMGSKRSGGRKQKDSKPTKVNIRMG